MDGELWDCAVVIWVPQGTVNSLVHESGSDVITLLYRHDVNGAVIGFSGTRSFHHDPDDVIHPGVVADDVEQDTRKQRFVLHAAVHGVP